MKLHISTTSKSWSQFEEEEWKKADLEHYGTTPNWDKQSFRLYLKEGAKTVANLRMDIRAGVAYVDALIVSDSKRGTGLGKRLMHEAEKVAQEHKAHKIFLQTGADWDAVIFYTKLGYEVTSQLPNHFLNHDFVEMTKFI